MRHPKLSQAAARWYSRYKSNVKGLEQGLVSPMSATINALYRWRRGLNRCLAFLLAVPLLGPARAADNLVDLQLVLAIDASNSVTDERFELQKRGHVAAFRNPQVIKAIASGSEQSIAVTMMQWTGPFTHVQVVPWMLVKDAASASSAGGRHQPIRTGALWRRRHLHQRGDRPGRNAFGHKVPTNRTAARSISRATAPTPAAGR